MTIIFGTPTESNGAVASAPVAPHPMATAWPPSVGARVRPVVTAPEAVSPEGEPVPLPGEGPAWSRLRYPPPSDGNDRREAMVALVEDAPSGSTGEEPTTHQRASVVWNDGTEQDDVPVAYLGPCVDDAQDASRPDRDSGDFPKSGASSETTEKHHAFASARTAAAAAAARGAYRFRRGDFAAAAAEYVQVCAMLLDRVPRRPRVLPGDAKDWTLTGAAAAAEREALWKLERNSLPAPRPAVGARARVVGADGAARLAVVACVDSDEETCDVLFETTNVANSRNEEEEEEEETVSFDRLLSASFAVANASESDSIESFVTLVADALLNIARCHLRLVSRRAGGDAAAVAAESAASASLSLRRNPVAYFLRGRAKLARRKFPAARTDLETALALFHRENSKGTRPNPTLQHRIRSVQTSLGEIRRTERRKNAADRTLARAVLGSVIAQDVDFGLDPASRPAAASAGFRSEAEAHARKKHGSLPVREVARLVRERVVGKRCVVS